MTSEWLVIRPQRGFGPAILGQMQRDIQNNPAPPQSYPVDRVVPSRLV
jgi:hypothetical protein